jgi:hypothetical protein
MNTDEIFTAEEEAMVMNKLMGRFFPMFHLREITRRDVEIMRELEPKSALSQDKKEECK